MKTPTALLCISVVLFGLGGCDRNANSIHPRRTSITEAVYASGTIHSSNEYKVFANANGLIRKIYAREGDSIGDNQLLVDIESGDPRIRVENAAEALDFARNNARENSAIVSELLLSVENAHARYTLDSLAFYRTSELYSNGSAARAELDRTQWTLQSSRAQWRAAQQKLESTRRSLRNQVDLAQRQLELARTSSQNFAVRSRIRGRIYAVYKEEGEMVSAQQPLMLAGDRDDFILHLVIDAADVARVQPGQHVAYTIDAFSDSIFTATVTRILPMLENETQSFRVDARCHRTPPLPFVGTQIQANIIVRTKDNALVIPRAYLHAGNTVLVRDGMKTTEVQVGTGVANLESVEITSGIDEQSVLLRHK